MRSLQNLGLNQIFLYRRSLISSMHAPANSHTVHAQRCAKKKRKKKKEKKKKKSLRQKKKKKKSA